MKGNIINLKEICVNLRNRFEWSQNKGYWRGLLNLELNLEVSYTIDFVNL